MRLPSITTPEPDTSTGASFAQGRTRSGRRIVAKTLTTAFSVSWETAAAGSDAGTADGLAGGTSAGGPSVACRAADRTGDRSRQASRVRPRGVVSPENMRRFRRGSGPGAGEEDCDTEPLRCRPRHLDIVDRVNYLNDSSSPAEELAHDRVQCPDQRGSRLQSGLHAPHRRAVAGSAREPLLAHRGAGDVRDRAPSGNHRRRARRRARTRPRLPEPDSPPL